MKIAILGYGKEGKSIENYFKNAEIKIFDHLTPAEFNQLDLKDFDLVFRSPSVPPLKHQTTTSITKYFFDHCPAPIIGVTGTKGKGTTCSLIKSLLDALGETTYLVGNIGTPALDVLDQLKPTDVVVYELSSFQLWDLEKSPHIATILRIEPDHLNIHKNYADYVNAKSNIARHQTPEDAVIYYKNNPDSVKIAKTSPGTQIPYLLNASSADKNADKLLDEILDSLALIGPHNRENALAALLTVAAFYQKPLDDFLKTHQSALKQGLKSFTGLPHRLEFVRELNGVKYYDDNFSTTLPSLEVALKSFPENPITLILGGRDKTGGQDLPKILSLLANTKNLTHVILIGESGHAIFGDVSPVSDKSKKDVIISTSTHPTFLLAESLEEAVAKAGDVSRVSDKSKKDVIISNATPSTTTNPPIVLMSPAAASFDMFENVYDRGAQYQTLVKALK